jgi:predicted amidohydrolase
LTSLDGIPSEVFHFGDPMTPILSASASETEILSPASLMTGEPGKLPEGWTLGGGNPAVLPTFKIVGTEGGGRVLEAQGNGRAECFGWIQHPATLRAGRTYRLQARFRFEGFEDLNRHLVHGVYGDNFNRGALDYQRQGDAVVVEGIFSAPDKDLEANVRLYFRFSPQGRVWWDQISLTETAPIPPRLVKICVTEGNPGMEHWTKVLDRAGSEKCDIVLLPEMFDANHDPLKPQLIDGPVMQLLSQKAAQYKMYVSGSLYLKRGDLTFNSAPLFDRSGKLVGMYDKNMLYDPELDQGASCGTDMPVFDTDLGKVGMMICYDSWHPSVAKLLALKGAELILFPSAGYYVELMYARAADNGVVIAASSLGSPLGVWDSGGTRAGEAAPEASRYAPSSIRQFQEDADLKLQFVTVDLAQKPSPHFWGGPMLSAPGGRRVRSTSPNYLEDEIAREVRRWEAARV